MNDCVSYRDNHPLTSIHPSTPTYEPVVVAHCPAESVKTIPRNLVTRQTQHNKAGGKNQIHLQVTVVLQVLRDSGGEKMGYLYRSSG